jgi:hypothetical protein
MILEIAALTIRPGRKRGFRAGLCRSAGHQRGEGGGRMGAQRIIEAD